MRINSRKNFKNYLGVLPKNFLLDKSPKSFDKTQKNAFLQLSFYDLSVRFVTLPTIVSHEIFKIFWSNL